MTIRNDAMQNRAIDFDPVGNAREQHRDAMYFQERLDAYALNREVDKWEDTQNRVTVQELAGADIDANKAIDSMLNILKQL